LRAEADEGQEDKCLHGLETFPESVSYPSRKAAELRRRSRRAARHAGRRGAGASHIPTGHPNGLVVDGVVDVVVEVVVGAGAGRMGMVAGAFSTAAGGVRRPAGTGNWECRRSSK
jgi:hypothetical protein